MVPLLGSTVFPAHAQVQNSTSPDQTVTILAAAAGLLLALIIAGLVLAAGRARRAARNWRLDHEQLATTLASMGDGVLTTDPEGRVTSLNPAAQQILGWSQEQARQRPLTEVFRLRPGENGPDGSPVDYSFKSVLRTGQPVKITRGTILETRHQGDILIADSAAPIRSADGRIRGLVIVFRDVTERINLERKLHNAQRMESVGRLAGGIAHDFNNMLTGIIGYAEILQLDLSDNPQQLQAVNNILQAGEKAADLTHRLLDFSRQGRILSSPLDLHAIIQNALGLLERTVGQSVTLEMDLAAPRAGMVGDPVQLQQAIINLCLNAHDAMPEGGTVRLSTRVVDLDESHCRHSSFTLTPGAFLRLTVQDTGPGIPAHAQDSLFEPFFTTAGHQDRRVGLGLAAVYGCVKAHQGAIKVQSRENQGATFVLDLPLHEVELLAVGEPPAPHPLPGPATVLVIDDDDTVRGIAEDLLVGLGFRVIAASGGKEGVDLFKKNIEQVDVVLLDLIMPGLSGRQTFHMIRDMDPHACVVLASGFAEPDSVRDLLNSGLCGFLHKPYRRSGLMQAIQDAGTRRRFLRGKG